MARSPRISCPRTSYAIVVVLLACIITTSLLIAPSCAAPSSLNLPIAQPVMRRLSPVHLRNITHRTCCLTSGLTFDGCSTERNCAYPRQCLTPHTLYPCPAGQVCVCYPARIVRCSDPAHCVAGETCAARPSDAHPFCVSAAVVDVDPSYLVVRGGCIPCAAPPQPLSPTTPEQPDAPGLPVIQEPPTDNRPPSVDPPAPSTPPKDDDNDNGGGTRPPSSRPPSTRPPSTRPPSTRPPTTRPPPTAASPTRRASPPPLRSPPPSPRASPPPPPPRPSRQPSFTAVAPPPRTSPPPTQPHPTAPGGGGPTRPTLPPPTSPPPGLAGDPCDAARPCRHYRRCMRKDRPSPCESGTDCICLGSRLCVCNDHCTDGELCAGAPGRSYCFSPRLVDELKWATTLPCVAPNPAFSPEAGTEGNGGGSPSTRPPPTAPPTAKIPGLTGDICRTDTNCRSPRKCIVGGGDSCAVPNVLCAREPSPCQSTDGSCYCFDDASCNCSEDCKDTEVCIPTVRGRLCVSREVLTMSTFLQAVECPSSGTNPNDPILIVNEAQPEPPAALSATPTPTPGRLGASPESVGQGAGEGDVCIDARALGDYLGHQLVFDSHRLARVLCDANESCATPGHIVVHQGVAMMMRSYCEIVSCVAKIMQVNSPRLRRQIRVPSSTDGLEFTALAARYETKAEELFLNAVVRVGL